MAKCNVCGVEQVKIKEFSMSINGEPLKGKFPIYNINLLTYINGKNICDGCMDIYHKIYALEHNMDFSCGGAYYFADGRNLK